MTVIRSWARTDIGRKRKHNEDSFLNDDALGLYIVADGMGGHAAGEVASAQAVTSIAAVFAESRALLESFRKAPTVDGRELVAQLMERAIARACADIYALSSGDLGKRGMGTTVVALLCVGNKAVVGHVGDSRIYLFRSGRAHQLTEDHTIIQEQLKRGLITREQIATADNKNVITRAVGIQPQVAVDTLVTDLLPGDLYLLCSDGLHGYFGDDELPQILVQEPRERLTEALTELALSRGGKDNITSVCVSIEAGEGEQAADVEGKTEMLRRIPLFQHMTYKELLAILGIAKGQKFEAGQSIILEGETGDELFVIFRGKVDVIKNGLHIAQLKPGGHFGEMGLVDQVPRSATVVASEATSAISIDRDNLLKLMRRDPLLAVKLLWSFVQVLSERLRNTNEGLTDLKSELDLVRRASDPGRPGSGGSSRPPQSIG
ncbi:MAG TPA: cyclic nucleotide-binding domain-containing protein [Myxococcales bacterium]|jgi:PPM family protein phosphatase|nr:cyclic nucleotide-binding domain-containing protein [Myxococcales bacterium]